MQTTENFKFKVIEGTDLVNPLLTEAPNWREADKILKKNQDNSIAPATENYGGSNHSITCTVKDAVFFKFTATSDYKFGDTFTFNTEPIQAYMPNGAGLTDNAFRTGSTVLCSVFQKRLTLYTNAATAEADDSKKLGGELPDFYGKAEDTIHVYTHSKVGNVNNFVGNGANGRVRIAADFRLGESVQVNGEPVTAYAGGENFINAVAGQNLTGRWLTFVYDGDSVNFKVAGGGKVTTVGLTAANVKSGITVSVKQGNTVVSSVTGNYDPIIFLGENTSFNVSGYENYGSFTEDNFIVALQNKKLEANGKTTGYKREVGNCDIYGEGSVEINKQYDASKGILRASATVKSRGFAAGVGAVDTSKDYPVRAYLLRK